METICNANSNPDSLKWLSIQSANCFNFCVIISPVGFQATISAPHMVCATWITYDNKIRKFSISYIQVSTVRWLNSYASYYHLITQWSMCYRLFLRVCPLSVIMLSLFNVVLCFALLHSRGAVMSKQCFLCLKLNN